MFKSKLLRSTCLFDYWISLSSFIKLGQQSLKSSFLCIIFFLLKMHCLVSNYFISLKVN